MTTIIRHEGVNDAGSYEVKFSDGRPPEFFNWDDGPIRPDNVTSEQALEKARAFGDAEREKETVRRDRLATFRRKISDFWIVADEVRKARPAALAAGVI